MRINKYIMAAGLLCGTAGLMMGKPAMRGIRTVAQPDGTTIQVRVVGDEHIHFTTTPDGTLLHKDADGYFRLGMIAEDGAVVTANTSAISLNSRQVGIKLTDAEFEKARELRLKNRKGLRKAAPAQSGIGRYDNTYPSTGSPKALVILVEYTDVKFNSSYNAKEYFNNLINGSDFTEYGGTGSALQYFKDQSGGKFTPSFDVYGPVTLPKSQSYYGKNDRWGEDQNAHLMVTDAIAILDPTVDFSQYDTDKDGYIDNVYVFYAGQGEADYGDDDTVWPHSWEVTESGLVKRADGVIINRYACSNEWSLNTPDGVGTFVHEFSHVMGLPDLYHTMSSSADYTPGSYSVMDYGPYNNDGRTPPNYSAYEKNAMGWFTPIMLDMRCTVSLKSIDSGQFGLIPTDKTNEFFLFENRQLKGWDKYIPNHGLLIWHIDYNQMAFLNNTVNNTRSHQYVDIIEACNSAGANYEKDYTFPGTTGKTSFTAQTTPAFKFWSGASSQYPITGIKDVDGIVTFDVAGGGDAPTSVESVVDDGAEPEYYNLQGVRIANPQRGSIVIERRGNSVRKVIF